jgi:hypothetical protein
MTLASKQVLLHNEVASSVHIWETIQVKLLYLPEITVPNEKW